MNVKRGLTIAMMAIAVVFALLVAPAFALAETENPDIADQPVAGTNQTPGATNPAETSGNDVNISGQAQGGNNIRAAGTSNDVQASGTGSKVQKDGTSSGVDNAGSDTGNGLSANAQEGGSASAAKGLANPAGGGNDASVLSIAGSNAPASPAAGNNGSVLSTASSNSPASPTAGSNSPNANEDALLTAQSEGALEDSLGPLEVEIAKRILMGAAYGAASSGVSWFTPDVLNKIFGGILGDGNDAKLDQILQKLDQIEKDVQQLSDKLTTQQLQDVLNDLHFLLTDTRMSTLYNALRKIDEDQAGGRISEGSAKQARLTALTTSLDINDLSNYNTDFDQYVNKMWSAMTVPYDVTIGDQPQKLTLMQVYYELLRRTHKWEHQAYEEWAAFQGSCVSLLMTSLTLEHASLQARIDQLNDSGRGNEAYAVFQQQLKITEQIYEAAGFDGDIVKESPNGLGTYRKHVSYPGLFSEKTWAAQYWMYKERPDYRYYWVPEHEILFYAQVNTQQVPQEPEDLGLVDDESLKGINVTWRVGNRSVFDTYDVTINHDFWKPFLRYQGGDSPLVSVSQLKQIYEDYGSDTHLYDIFIGKDEGNFLGLEEGEMEHWWFVVDQDKGHKLTYKKHTTKADELYCYIVTSKNAKTTTTDLCKYHRSSHDGNNHHHYIGIGVARVGPETYSPGKTEALPSAKGEIHTAVLYSDDLALWWPSFGDLALSYGDGVHGGVKSVLVDGNEVDASCYTVSNGKIVFSQAFMASLSFGEHEFFLDTDEGGHSFMFSTQADGVYYVISGEGAQWTPGMVDGVVIIIKRTTDDAQTVYRLVDVLIDGVSVPQWGYTISSGSAIITLTEAFLKTLSAGAHTLTAIFEDGNNVNATFSVENATSNANANAKSLPQTGDMDSGMIALAMGLALVSVLCLIVTGFALRRQRESASSD